MNLHGITRYLADHRWYVVFGLITITIGVGQFARLLHVDNSVEVWFVDDDPALLSYKTFFEEFGNDEVIVTAITGTTSALDPMRMERLERISELLQDVEGVERVLSLATLPEGRMELAEEVERGRVASKLVGEDGTTQVVYAWLEASSHIDAQRAAVLERVRMVYDEQLKGHEERAHHAGMGVMYDALNQATLGEGAMFIGLSYLVVILALWFITRSLVWTFLAVLVITITDVVLIGIMAWMGRPLTMITMAVPALVMILGVANIVHMTTRIEALPDGKRGRSFVIAALAAIAVPCLFNALTTAAGFLSLTTANMAITRDYGLFAAIGVLLAFLFSFVLMSVAADYVPKMKTRRAERQGLARAAERLSLWGYHNKSAVIIGALGLIMLAGLGIARLEVDTNSLNFFPEGHEYRQHSNVVEASAGYYMPLEFVLETPEVEGWKDLAFLGALTSVQEELESDGAFGHTASIADVVHDLSMRLPVGFSVWTAMMGSSFKPALTAMVIEENPDMVEAFISEDGHKVRMLVFAPMNSAKALRALSQKAEGIIQEGMGNSISVNASGYVPLYVQMIVHILSDQVSSLVIAFTVIFLLIALILRSTYLSGIAMLLNAFPVAAVLGFMGFVGIRLDVATVTIAAALLGIVVDDTVHVLYHLRKSVGETDSIETAIRSVARQSGLAIMSTSFIFVLGFSVIAMASLRSVAYVGLLISFGVIAALLADLILMPALMAFHPKAKTTRVTTPPVLGHRSYSEQPR